MFSFPDAWSPDCAVGLLCQDRTVPAPVARSGPGGRDGLRGRLRDAGIRGLGVEELSLPPQFI